MPIVIPAVAGAVIAALAEVALDIAIVGAILMMAGLAYWLLTHARQTVAVLPVIGGAAAGVLDNGVNILKTVTNGYKGVIDSNLWYLAHNFRAVLNWYVTPAILPILQTLVDHRNWLNFISGDQLPKLWARVSAAEQVLTDHLNWLKFISNDQLPKLWSRITLAEQVLVNHRNWLGFITNDQLPKLWGRVTSLRDDLDFTIKALAAIQAYAPLLRTLAEIDAGMVGGIRTLPRRVADLETGEADILKDMAKVLPLSVLAALGLVAIANLARVAKDPCYCLNLGDFSDLPMRVAALEEMGT